MHLLPLDMLKTLYKPGMYRICHSIKVIFQEYVAGDGGAVQEASPEAEDMGIDGAAAAGKAAICAGCIPDLAFQVCRAVLCHCAMLTYL